jgi:hypothetical protein
MGLFISYASALAEKGDIGSKLIGRPPSLGAKLRHYKQVLICTVVGFLKVF